MRLNQKQIFGFIILLLIAFALIYYLISRPSLNGRVLGSSINNFYSSKLVKVVKPPVRKADAKDPIINAGAAVLLSDQSKYPLYSKNASQSVPIASITKIMTAAVVLDIYKLEDVIKVSKESTQVIGSVIGLEVDEQITVENLLYGLLVNSGNDAAVTLATSKTTQEQFVAKMNAKALELGLTQSSFKDPAGLDDNGRSTANDIAMIFSYMLKNPTFTKMIGTAEYEISSTDGTIKHQLKNSNRMINGEMPFDGVIGGKTGFTPEAGHGLVCAAQRDGNTIVAVILNTQSSSVTASAQENRKLLEWGFESFTF